MESEHRGAYFSCTAYGESKHGCVDWMNEIKEMLRRKICDSHGVHRAGLPRWKRPICLEEKMRFVIICKNKHIIVKFFAKEKLYKERMN